jgi:hypothetical protein
MMLQMRKGGGARLLPPFLLGQKIKLAQSIEARLFPTEKSIIFLLRINPDIPSRIPGRGYCPRRGYTGEADELEHQEWRTAERQDPGPPDPFAQQQRGV